MRHLLECSTATMSRRIDFKRCDHRAVAMRVLSSCRPPHVFALQRMSCQAVPAASDSESPRPCWPERLQLHWGMFNLSFLIVQVSMELLSASTAVASCSSSWKRPALPEASQTPPDVMLHVGGCVFALHLEVIRWRWPWLHQQLEQLTNGRPTAASFSPFKLQLKAEKDAQVAGKGAQSCPLQTITLLKPLLYTKCLAPRHQRTIEDEDCSEEEQEFHAGRKRQRQDKAKTLVYKENDVGNRGHSSKRARRLFDSELMADLSMAEPPWKVLHVELLGAAAIAVVPVVEYVYTFKVRLLHDSSAMPTLRLAQWVNMGDRIRYSCLKVAVRQVKLDSWMEQLAATDRLSKQDMRRNLCYRLVDFLYELQPVQYQTASDKLDVSRLQMIDDHFIIVRVVVALLNHVRLLGFWLRLLDALVKWLKRKFNAPQLPSLRVLHEHFVTDWEPYVELPRVECFTTTSSASAVPLHVTLFAFGDFVLQACINATGPSPLLWRVIRRTSPKFFSEDPELVDDAGALAGDPEFWIRGQLVVKYQPSDRGGAVVTEERRIEYQHCGLQYCKWKSLVPASPSSSAPTTSPRDEGWVNHEDPVHNYYRRTVCAVSGKLFLWGDPVCSLYHQLLQMTLFYSAPSNLGPEVADIMTVSEMQTLPMDTLVLVLCSDRLRVPDGECTLLRRLNMMIFGLDVYHLDADAPLPRACKGRIEDAARLYRCVRWCFVPLDDIIATLRWAPRQLKLYEIIAEGLRNASRCHKRRRPFGWRKFRDAYLTNETNLSEFEIEAGDLNLAPSTAADMNLLSPASRYGSAGT
jgi:hypothetical protein